MFANLSTPCPDILRFGNPGCHKSVWVVSKGMIKIFKGETGNRAKFLLVCPVEIFKNDYLSTMQIN